MLQLNFEPFPEFESERLIFTRTVSSDFPEVIRLRSDPETMKFIPRPYILTEQDALDHIANIDEKINALEGINWAIRIKNSTKLIGLAGHYRIQPEHFRAEIGYMLLPEYHGKGFMTEALQRLVTYGFEEMKLHSIEAVIDPRNDASEKVLIKNGFVKEAHFKENEYYNGEFIDSVVYSILNK